MAIESKLQYTITRDRLRLFEHSLDRLLTEPLADQEQPIFRTAQIDAHRSIIEELQGDIARWEQQNGIVE